LLSAAADELAADPHLREIAPRVSGKALRLIELIVGLFREHAGDSGYRGIIFVDQIALPTPLARLLNTHSSELDGLNVLHVSGIGSMPDAQRERAMADFARGCSRLLVCTAALEEGVDVSDCSFVVRFSRFATTRSHIQGAGRARRAGAEVFYFVNDAQGERREDRTPFWGMPDAM
jgi:superfamily II DNA/RNA helicase